MLSLFALPALTAEPNLYGHYRWVSLPEPDYTLQVKMDIGAYISLLSARDIELLQRDGEGWVHFRLATKGVDDPVSEHELARIGRIKNRADGRNDEDEDEDRLSEHPMIDLQVCLGGAVKTIEINLTDHSVFNHPFLIGTKSLHKFHVAVDPSGRFVADKPTCK